MIPSFLMGRLSIKSKSFKEYHQRRLDEKKYIAYKNEEKRRILEEKEKEKEEIAKLSAPFKSSWKSELFSEEVEVKNEVVEVVKEKKWQEEVNEIAERFKYNWKKELLDNFNENKCEPIVKNQSKVTRLLEVTKERSIISDKNTSEISEGMTSSGMFIATFPGQGDTDLVVTSLDASSYDVDDSGNVSFSSGTDSGFTGGFSSSDGIINLGGEDNWSSGFVSDNFDFSAVDTVNITAIAGNNSNGGMLPTRNLNVYFATTDDFSDAIEIIPTSASSFRNVNITIPEKFRTSDVFLIIDTNTSDGTGAHGRHFRSQTIPISGLNHTTMDNLFPDSGEEDPASTISSYLRNSRNSQDNFRSLGWFIWFNSMLQRFDVVNNLGTEEEPEYEWVTWPAAPVSGATNYNDTTDADYIYIGQTVYNLFKGTQLYGISNISFRRRKPMNVFVSLDSPEATAFIRTDPIMRGLSAAERYKKLEDLLNAGDEYILKALGMQSSATRPADTGNVKSWDQAANEVDYGDDLTPLSDNPYGTELAQIASVGDLGMLGMGIEGLAAAASLGVAGLMAAYNMSKEMATWLVNKYGSDPYGQDQAGPTTTGQPLPGAKNLTPQQQADVEAAGNELRDARRALNDLPADATDAQRDMAKARLDKATKRRQSLRKKHREENKNRKESFEINGEVLTEKKRLKSPKDLQNKIPGYYDGKPAPLGFPMEPPAKMINGFHSDLVTPEGQEKQSNRYNRMDRATAKAMPMTGNSYIDKKIIKARLQPK